MHRSALVALPLCLSASAMAQVPTVIYSEIITSPTSLVPGLGGARFDSFLRPYANPSGTMWSIQGSSDLVTTTDDVLIVGSSVTGTLVLQEGTQAPWAPSGSLVALVEERTMINDSGHFAFGLNLGGTAPTTTDEQMVAFNGGFVVYAAEGSPVPGFPDELLGTVLHSGIITNAGTLGYAADATVGTQPTTSDDFLIFNGSAVGQEGITIPTGAAEAWENFALNDYWVSGDESKSLVVGDLLGATTADNVVVFNGAVAIREDGTIPGIVGPVETIVESFMNTNGDWFSRGDVDSQEDWLVYNGNLIAKTGDPVPGGLPGELYDDTLFAANFFSMTGDGQGNYVIGATTSNPDPLRDAVLVHNGTTVLLRQSDGIDLDGNGLLDDNVFINIFNNDDAFLTPDGWYYFTGDLMDGAGLALGQGFIRVKIPDVVACYPDCDGDGVLAIDDFICFQTFFAVGC
jgi:hypothetical protein